MIVSGVVVALAVLSPRAAECQNTDALAAQGGRLGVEGILRRARGAILMGAGHGGSPRLRDARVDQRSGA